MLVHALWGSFVRLKQLATRRSLLRGCLRGAGVERVQAWLQGSCGHGLRGCPLGLRGCPLRPLRSKHGIRGSSGSVRSRRTLAHNLDRVISQGQGGWGQWAGP
jgi:hypothetical protein